MIGPIYEHLEPFLHSRVRRVGRSLDIFCPFVRSSALVRLLRCVPDEAEVRLTMRWGQNEFMAGACDPDVYEVCRKRNVGLRKLASLHLKMFIIDESEIVAGSANLSDRALGIGHSNLEFMVGGLAYSVADRIALVSIWESASEVSASDYLEACETYQKRVAELGLEELDSEPQNSSVLLDQIPTGETPEALWRAYLAGVAHPLLFRYSIPVGLDESGFASALRSSFFGQPVVRRLTERLHRSELYFGELKRWLLETVTDADALGARDVTEHAAALLTWIDRLGAPKFTVDRPNYSERLRYDADLPDQTVIRLSENR
jgi:hypothetical protein